MNILQSQAGLELGKTYCFLKKLVNIKGTLMQI